MKERLLGVASLGFAFLLTTAHLTVGSGAARRMTAKLGSSEVLDCSISDEILQDFSSEHMLEWRKKNRDLPIFITFNGYPPHVDEEYQGRLQLVGISSLLVSNIQVGDEGWYNCFVVFIERTSEEIINGSWIYLSLQVPPNLIKTSPSFVTGKVGETLELFCHASGAPQPIINWHKNGKELPTVPLINTPEHNDHIDNNHLEHHDLHQHQQHHQHHHHQQQQQQQQHHHEQQGIGYRQFIISDQAILWSDRKARREINSELRRLIMYDYNLQFPSLEREDSGLYTCTLNNAAGQAQHMMRLIVEDSNWTYSGSAYITIPPSNQTSMEGTRVKLTCHAEGAPNVVTYNWFKDDVSVQTLPSLMARSGLYADGSLVIKSLLKEDMGWYKCKTFNGVGQPVEAAAFLNVTYLPRVVVSGQEKMESKKFYLARGLTGRIDCPVDANPPASVIMWSKNDRFIVPSSSQRLRISKHGMLVIRDIDVRDEGLYSCLPYSPLGKGNKSESFQVFVREAPHFKVRPEVFYQRSSGESVVMPCVAAGDPQPKIRWQKADGPFPPSTKTLLDGGNLTIAKLDHSDSGLYECLGLSPVITIITSSYLIIENVSHPAEVVSVICGNESASISWVPAFQAGHSLHYLIWYRELQEKDFSEWKTVPVLPNHTTMATLYGLLPNKVHHFQITSTTSHGASQTSNSMACSTKESPDANFNHVSHSNSRRSNSTLDYEIQEYSEDDDDEDGDVDDEGQDAAADVDDDDDGDDDDDDGGGGGGGNGGGGNGGGDDGDEDGDAYERSDEGDSHDNSHVLRADVRLMPPTNLHVYQTRAGLNITWQPPLLPIVNRKQQKQQQQQHGEEGNLFLPVRYYLIQFKTMGHWITLEERIPAHRTHHLWTTHSRGASSSSSSLCSFRMFSVNGPWQSNSSQIFALKTEADLLPFVGPLTSSAVGGLMGLLVFLIFAVICSVIAFKYFVKWRQREKISSRYGNVKYIGPHQVDGMLNKNQQHNDTETAHSSQKEIADEIAPSSLDEMERISEEKAIKETPI